MLVIDFKSQFCSLILQLQRLKNYLIYVRHFFYVRALQNAARIRIRDETFETDHTQKRRFRHGAICRTI